MSGETDLGVMLASISVTRRPGTWAFVAFDPDADDPDADDPDADDRDAAMRAAAASGADAVIREAEGVTAVLNAAQARELGHQVEFEAAWLTLDVHSSLDAVGLTAAVSAALAAEGIPCNVIAAYHHDHLLVPDVDADRAIAAIEALRSSAVRSSAVREEAGSDG